MKAKEKETSVIMERDFSDELLFTASRSQGPGGQNVNKVNTKIELRFHVESSRLLSPEEKVRVSKNLRNKLTDGGYLVVTSQTERSQVKNKEATIEKFNRILVKALSVPKKRKASRPTKTSVEKRLSLKRLDAEKKEMRKKPDW